MRITGILLTIMLISPGALQAAIQPEFAELEALPKSDTLVLPLAESGNLPDSLPAALREQIDSALAGAEFKPKKDKSVSLYGIGAYARVIVIGLGSEPVTASALENLGGVAAKQAGSTGGKLVNVVWENEVAGIPSPAAHIALGLQLGAYSFDKYKTDQDDKEKTATDNRFVVYSAGSDAAASEWRENWAGVADGVYFARNVINEPANVIYPESFVEQTRKAFKGVRNVSIKVLDVRAMEKLGMGALLGVGMGSERPPRLLVIRYQGGAKGAAPLAFVGKGVTFDSGGISIKRSKGMWRMKYDMSGAAAVTGTLLALAKRKAPVNAVAVAALVENMPSQRAQRPGDVRKSMSGKTVEVINTDAEGRLILADAVWYAQKQFKPSIMVDVATLTGSIKVALGTTYAGVFSRHDELAQQLIASGKTSSEEVWRMPLHETYVKAIKSDIADVKNSVEGGSAGASTGAEFIGSFVETDTVWAHLDIAGKAWQFKGNPTTPKGAAGWGVRLLNQLTLDYYQ
jgi:leucyl aminopeptidase